MSSYFLPLGLTFKAIRGQAPPYLEKLTAADHTSRPLTAGLGAVPKIFETGMSLILSAAVL